MANLDPTYPGGALTLTCPKCTRQAVFVGADLEHSCEIARAKGWVLRNGKPICKKCPK